MNSLLEDLGSGNLGVAPYRRGREALGNLGAFVQIYLQRLVKDKTHKNFLIKQQEFQPDLQQNNNKF
jgi:hypothetical protein